VVVGAAVLVEVTNIGLGEVVDKTVLSVLDFESGEGVVVVLGGVVNELIVEGGLKEHLEVGHDTGLVAVLVLSEKGHKTVVTFVNLGVNLGLGGESESELEDGERGDSPHGRHNTMLYKTRVSSPSIKH